MKIWGARRKPAQNRSLEPADVLALAADHGLSCVGDFVDLAGQRTLHAGQGEHRQSRNVEKGRRLGAGIRDTDIQRCLHRMVADIGRVVTGAAEPRNAREIEIVVKARDASNVDRGVVEHLLPACDRLSMGRARAWRKPGPIEIEDVGCEWSMGRILPQWIVYADEEARKL